MAWVLAGTVPGAWQAGAVVGRAVTAGGEIVAVVDADTVAVGRDGAERLRLAGFDAPEIYSARCPLERELGLVAAGRLMALMRGGRLELKRLGKREKWGRGLARLTAGGRDVGETLIADGLARPYAGGRRRGWCGSAAETR